MSAAQPSQLPVSGDPLQVKVLTIYAALKQVVSEHDRFNRDPERRKFYLKASSLTTKINSAQKSVKRDWHSLSEGQRLLLLDLLLGYYCRSRRGDDISASVSWSQMHTEIRRVTGSRSSETVSTFVHLLGVLYSAPIDDSEFFAFAQSRKTLMTRRRALTIVRDAGGTAAEDAVRLAQEELDETVAEREAMFQQLNSVRRALLERLETAQRLLLDRARVPAAADGAQRTALAFFFGRLHPDDQALVVESARDLLYTACLERAVHDRALDPVPLLGKLFEALSSSELESAWRCELVSHDLALIIHFYRAHGAPASVADGLADLLVARKASWATNLFPRLPIAMQERAVSHCRKLLLDAHAQWEHRKTLYDAARMYDEFLALLAPWELRSAAQDPVARW
ncbi:hypothetical protein JCM8208_005867 [Rhodotorula glutinis]